MTFILVFMGSPQRMRNPHLRARMTELLVVMIPKKDEPCSSIGALLTRFVTSRRITHVMSKFRQ